MGIYPWNKFWHLTCEISFFPARTTFTKRPVWWLRPLCYCEYSYDCKQKKIDEMLLTTFAHNQHDVIDVIWRLPVWNVKIWRYLASCTLQCWSNLTEICFQGRHFNYCCACRITYFQDGRSFQLQPLASLLVDSYLKQNV